MKNSMSKMENSLARLKRKVIEENISKRESIAIGIV